MNRCAGFSLLELVTVMLLLGIASTFVIGRAGSDFKAVRDAEELIQAIRYTQERAMHHTGDGQNYRITLGATGYSLSPAAAPLYADNLDGLLEGGSLSPTGVIAFDGRGLPSCSGGLACAAAAQNILVSAGGDSVSLTLQPYTGMVNR
jgi:prepilin-type N-terminal cleavage/methylation domain-containing protein